MRAFLRWATDVARPDESAPRLLTVVARLARAGWLEGTPYIELRGDDTTTTVSIFCDHGIGIRERIVPLARLQVPFEEFARAMRLAPQLVSPLSVTHKPGALSLSPPGMPEDRASSSTLRNSIAIDERSLHGATRPPFERPRRPVTTAPPSNPEQSGVHTRPTVRQMVAIGPEAFRSRNEE
ncbi:MAG TPA: hypothetical protein VM925_34490 [Labilithrix sp.]|nr:hypothetical protein [Labilithrix sp.]